MKPPLNLLTILSLLPAPMVWGQVVVPAKMINDQAQISLSGSPDGSVIMGSTNNLSANSNSLRKIDATGKVVWDFRLLIQTANHTNAGFTKHIVAHNGDILVCGGGNLYHPDQQDGNYPNLFRIDPCGNVLWSKTLLVDTVVDGFNEIYEYSNGNILVHSASIYTGKQGMLHLFDATGRLLKQQPSPIEWARFSEAADSNYLYASDSRWIPSPADSTLFGRFGCIYKLNKNTLNREWIYPKRFEDGLVGAALRETYEIGNNRILANGSSWFGNNIRDGIFILSADSGKLMANYPYTPSDSTTIFVGSFCRVGHNKFLAVSTVHPSTSSSHGFLEFRLIDSTGKLLKINKTNYLAQTNYTKELPDKTYMVSFSWVTGGSNGIEAALLRIDSNLNILKWPTQDTVTKDPLCIGGHPSYIEFAGDSADSIRVVNEWSPWTYWPHIGIKSMQNVSNGLSIYPNPTRGLVHLVFKDNETDYSVRVFDIQGRFLQQGFYKNPIHIPIDLSDNASGMYFIELVSGDTRKVVKVVVE